LDGAERLYGVINVRLVQCGGDACIKQRRFLLTNVREKRSRELSHLQYMEWPDWGFPSDCSAFLRLVDYVDEHNASGGPIVVHCRFERALFVVSTMLNRFDSAGIGRTGTFCTVHAALEKFRAERAGLVTSGDVDDEQQQQQQQQTPAAHRAAAREAMPMAPLEGVSRDGTPPAHLSIVRLIGHLRAARPGMVQTKDQMQFTYTAIIAALQREMDEPVRDSTIRGRTKVKCCWSDCCCCCVFSSFVVICFVGNASDSCWRNVCRSMAWRCRSLL
jgi:hypothetical protein